jgi:hypothetical protein
MKNRIPLETYLEDAGRLAQNVVNAWGQNWYAGNTKFTPEFNILIDKACRHLSAKRVRDNHREFNILSEQGKAEEETARRAFAQAYKVFHERHLS